MVDDVVVARPHAAAVRAVAQRALDVRRGRRPRDDLDGPVVLAALGHPEVEPLRRPRAARLQRAVQTAVGGAVGPVLRPQVGQRAEGGHRRARAADEVREPVEVVAALGQQHRPGLVLAAPVAADVGVGLVPEADRLEVLDVDDLARRAGLQQPPDEPRVGRVAEHVRDGGDDPRALARLRDRHALRLARRERLLDQQRVALLRQRERRLQVVAVERRDDRRVGDAARRRRLAPAGEAAAGRDAVLVPEPVAADGSRVGDRDHRGLGRVAPGPVRERRAAGAGAHHQQRDHQNVASALLISSSPCASASSGLVSPASALFTFL